MFNKIIRNIFLFFLIACLSSCVFLYQWNKHLNERAAAYENKENLAGCTKDAILSRFGEPEREITSEVNGSGYATYIYKLGSDRQMHIIIRDGIVRSFFYK